MAGKVESARQKQKDTQVLMEFIEEIKYGSVTVTIQDGKIVQIEKCEKVRFT